MSIARTCLYSINFPIDCIFFIACSADNPFSIKSSVRGPSVGSVIFCEATAPTLARAKEHRAATAGEEDEIAMPNIPVLAHRATSENVMLV